MEKNFEWIEIEKGVFISAETSVQFVNLHTGCIGFKSLKHFIKDKQVVTVSNYPEGSLVNLQKMRAEGKI